MNIAMTLNILTKGWIARILVITLWLCAVFIPMFFPETPMITLFIVTSAVFLYSVVSSRLPLLVHQSMSNILPHYFDNIKKSLLIIMIASLIPTLLLLPNVVLWLDAIAGLLMVAILLAASSYQPKYSWLIVVIILSPYPINNFDVAFVSVPFKNILAFTAPFLALWAYYLLSKLETYKGNEKHVARMTALTSLSTKNALIIEDELPVESRNKFWRWWINSNFSYFRTLIRKEKKLSHSQLIEVSCQGYASVGRFTYLFWIFAVVIFITIGSFISEDSQKFLIPMMIIFPAMFIGTGTITVLQSITYKRTLLQRLSIMPTFSKPKSFINAFLTYVIFSQVKLYAFISVVISALVLTFHHLSMDMYMNVLYGCIIICLLNLAIILYAWQENEIMVSVSIWLMVAIFIGFMVLLLVVGDNQILLWQNILFNSFSLFVVGLFASAIYKSFHANNSRKLIVSDGVVQ